MRCVNKLVVCAGLGLFIAACSSGATSSDQTATDEMPIVGATASTNHPEVVTLSQQNGLITSSRSAVLVGPMLAVTALENVVKDVSYGVGEGSQSSGTVCGTVGATANASAFTLTIPNGTSVGVTAIITNGSTGTCDSAYAFLVLSTAVTGVTFPQLQLDKAPATNDAVTECGYGPIDTSCGSSTQPSCLSGKMILYSTGQGDGYYAPITTQFPAGYGLTTVSACGSGDQGGAVYDAAGGLLGVIDSNFQPDSSKRSTIASPCLACDGTVSDFQLLSTQLDLVTRAFAAVNSAPRREGHPEPAGIGGSCTGALDCNSQFCVEIGSSGYCSQSCDTVACPESTVCTTVNSRNVCLPSVTPHPASCASAPQRKTDSGQGIAGVLFGVGIAVVRRTRKRKHRRSSAIVSNALNGGGTR